MVKKKDSKDGTRMEACLTKLGKLKAKPSPKSPLSQKMSMVVGLLLASPRFSNRFGKQIVAPVSGMHIPVPSDMVRWDSQRTQPPWLPSGHDCYSLRTGTWPFRNFVDFPMKHGALNHSYVTVYSIYSGTSYSNMVWLVVWNMFYFSRYWG